MEVWMVLTMFIMTAMSMYGSVDGCDGVYYDSNVLERGQTVMTVSS